VFIVLEAALRWFRRRAKNPSRIWSSKNKICPTLNKRSEVFWYEDDSIAKISEVQMDSTVDGEMRINVWLEYECIEAPYERSQTLPRI